MQVALVGLSQSGKSTLFAALAEGHAHAAASAAHQADRAVVHVPDVRLDELSKMYKPKKTVHATIEFLDLPGLRFEDEPGRHEARRVIAQARQADMLVLVVRAFESDAVAAYRHRIDAVADLAELRDEFLLADLELVTNRIERLEKSKNKPTKTQEQDKRELAMLQRCQETIENERPVTEAVESAEQEKMLRSFGFLTLKPMLVVVNAEEGKVNDDAGVGQAAGPMEVLVLSAQLEAELAALKSDERAGFLAEMGLSQIAGERLIKGCYSAMNLVSFLTVQSDEVRAWTVPSGCCALEAAGEIHGDIQRGFIRAETVHYDDFQGAGDMKAAKAAGKVRLEGKGYEVQDGDIITFRFNV